MYFSGFELGEIGRELEGGEGLKDGMGVIDGRTDWYGTGEGLKDGIGVIDGRTDWYGTGEGLKDYMGGKGEWFWWDESQERYGIGIKLDRLEIKLYFEKHNNYIWCDMFSSIKKGLV